MTRLVPTARKQRQTKPWQAGTVGKGSRTGNAECSSAMSTWVRARNAGTAVASAIFAVLGKCRSMARQRNQAMGLRQSGNDLKAQALESRLQREGISGAITQKDRIAKAKALVAQRRAAQSVATKPAPTLAAGRGTPDRLARAAWYRQDRANTRSAKVALAKATAKEANPVIHRPTGVEIKGTPGNAPHARISVARWTRQRLAKAQALRSQRAAKSSATPNSSPAMTLEEAMAGRKAALDRMTSSKGKAQDAAVAEYKAWGAKVDAARAASKTAKPAASSTTVAAPRPSTVKQTWRVPDGPIHEQALAAAKRVSLDRRFGGRVLIAHAWEQYHKGGGKLNLQQFKAALDTPEGGRMTSRADMGFMFAPGLIKGSGINHESSYAKHWIEVGRHPSESSSGLNGRSLADYRKPAPASEKAKAAAVVARTRAARATAKARPEMSPAKFDKLRTKADTVLAKGLAVAKKKGALYDKLGQSSARLAELQAIHDSPKALLARRAAAKAKAKAKKR